MKTLKEVVIGTIVAFLAMTYFSGCTTAPKQQVNPIESCRNMCMQGTVEYFKEGITECRCFRERSKG